MNVFCHSHPKMKRKVNNETAIEKIRKSRILQRLNFLNSGAIFSDVVFAQIV